MTSIDLLIKAHSVLQFDIAHYGVKPTPRVKADWALNIKDRHLVALDPHAEIVGQHQVSATLELPNHLLIPGLINLQSHALSIVDRGDSGGVDVFSGAPRRYRHICGSSNRLGAYGHSPAGLYRNADGQDDNLCRYVAG